MIHENAWTTYSADDLKELEALSADYIDFLNNGKTERECAQLIVEMAKKKGYRDLADVIANGNRIHVLMEKPLLARVGNKRVIDSVWHIIIFAGFFSFIDVFCYGRIKNHVRIVKGMYQLRQSRVIRCIKLVHIHTNIDVNVSVVKAM